jgi:cytochrome c oxidase cbb3-type subunit 3
MFRGYEPEPGSGREVTMHYRSTERSARKIPGALITGVLVLLGAISLRASAAHSQTDSHAEQVQRGRKQFVQSCGFCHGVDATGGRAPDLVRSPLVAHDQKGELIGEVIRNGRPDKGMPALPMTPEQIADIAAFLHARALEALESSGVPRDYPAEKLTTGKVEAGKAFFEGPGGCSGCHANPAELAAAGRKYSSIEFESHMLYPEDKPITAVVTLRSGEQIRGKVIHLNDFVIGVEGEGGWYKSFSREKVKVEIQDPLEAHRRLLPRLRQADMHNLFTYLYSLR